MPILIICGYILAIWAMCVAINWLLGGKVKDLRSSEKDFVDYLAD